MPSQRSNNRRFILFIKSQLNFFGQKFVFHFEWWVGGQSPSSIYNTFDWYTTYSESRSISTVHLIPYELGDSHKECPMSSNSVQLFISSFLPRDFFSYSSTSPVLDHTSCNSLVLANYYLFSHNNSHTQTLGINMEHFNLKI